MRKRSRTFFGSRSITLAGAGLCVGAAWIASIAAAENPQLALSTPAETADLLSPLDVHPRISLTIVEQLRHNHYLEKDLDDQQSSHIFENYLGMLDGAKVYFTAADVAAMEQYRYKLDDALVRGNLVPAFEIFNRYQERLTDGTAGVPPRGARARSGSDRFHHRREDRDRARERAVAGGRGRA